MIESIDIIFENCESIKVSKEYIQSFNADIPNRVITKDEDLLYARSVNLIIDKNIENTLGKTNNLFSDFDSISSRISGIYDIVRLDINYKDKTLKIVVPFYIRNNRIGEDYFNNINDYESVECNPISININIDENEYNIDKVLIATEFGHLEVPSTLIHQFEYEYNTLPNGKKVFTYLNASFSKMFLVFNTKFGEANNLFDNFINHMDLLSMIIYETNGKQIYIEIPYKKGTKKYNDFLDISYDNNELININIKS